MATKLTLIGHAETMTSREIADLAAARHNDVCVTIERLFTKGLLRSSRKSRIEATGGRPVSVYDLTQRDTYIVMAGYSDEIRVKIVDRWQELELELASMKKALSDRSDTRLEFFPMTDALIECRALAGKDCRPHHFSNESDLLNRIALGMTAAKFRVHHDIDTKLPLRDYLTPAQIACIKDLQRANMVMLQMGETFEHRKDRLGVLFSRQHAAKLTAEVLRLSA